MQELFDVMEFHLSVLGVISCVMEFYSEKLLPTYILKGFPSVPLAVLAFPVSNEYLYFGFSFFFYFYDLFIFHSMCIGVKVPDLLELDFQTAMSCHMGARN